MYEGLNDMLLYDLGLDDSLFETSLADKPTTLSSTKVNQPLILENSPITVSMETFCIEGMFYWDLMTKDKPPLTKPTY